MFIFRRIFEIDLISITKTQYFIWEMKIAFRKYDKAVLISILQSGLIVLFQNHFIKIGIVLIKSYQLIVVIFVYRYISIAYPIISYPPIKQSFTILK